MPTSDYGARQVRAKTNEVRDYHYDESRPGKPLHLLIPGGLIALAAIGLIIYIAYATWYKGDMESSQAVPLIALLAPFYIGGVFLFSYGYELYDMPKALKLTAIVVFITIAFVVIIAVLFVLASGESKGGSSSKSSSSSDSGKSSSSSSTSSTSSGGTYHHHDSDLGDVAATVLLSNSGPTRTQVVEKEVIKEVPVAPKSIACPFCGKSYVPADSKFACPSCGAPTPKELVEQSAAPSEPTTGASA